MYIKDNYEVTYIWINEGCDPRLYWDSYEAQDEYMERSDCTVYFSELMSIVVF